MKRTVSPRWKAKGLQRYGGEGGSRTHEPGFARLPAFEAGSFDHSDTSPRWLSHSNGGVAVEQRRRCREMNLRGERATTPQRTHRNPDWAALPTASSHAKWQECRDSLPVRNVGRAKPCCQFALLETNDNQGQHPPDC